MVKSVVALSLGALGEWRYNGEHLRVCVEVRRAPALSVYLGPCGLCQLLALTLQVSLNLSES